MIDRDGLKDYLKTDRYIGGMSDMGWGHLQVLDLVKEDFPLREAIAVGVALLLALFLAFNARRNARKKREERRQHVQQRFASTFVMDDADRPGRFPPN